MEKLDFIISFPSSVLTLDLLQKGNWGKMNAGQMVEHVADFFKVSSGKLVFPLQVPEEQLPKLKAFLLSDKEFRENTKGPEGVVPEEPFPLRNTSMQDAVTELQKETDDFIRFFENNAGGTTTHPVFGVLNFDEWVLLHYKHLRHHAKQFGLL